MFIMGTLHTWCLLPAPPRLPPLHFDSFPTMEDLCTDKITDVKHFVSALCGGICIWLLNLVECWRYRIPGTQKGALIIILLGCGERRARARRSLGGLPGRLIEKERDDGRQDQGCEPKRRENHDSLYSVCILRPAERTLALVQISWPLWSQW